MATPRQTGRDTLRGQLTPSRAALLDFLRRSGTMGKVPAGATHRGYLLPPAASALRARYQDGQVPPDVAARFDAIPGWDWNPRAEGPQSARTVRGFVGAGGHLSQVDKSTMHEGASVARAVERLRRARREGGLSPAIAEALEQLPGWTWESTRGRPRRGVAAVVVRGRISFADGLALLVAFVEREGHARVPRGHVEQGRRLGEWVRLRRRQHRSGTLGTERTARLEQLPGWTWDPLAAREATSDQLETPQGTYEVLKAFTAAGGRVADVLDDDALWHGVRLRPALTRLSRLYDRDRLPPKLIEELEALPGWSWGKHEDRFLYMLGLLRQYARREGHSLVPQDHIEDGKRLGRWVSRVRRATNLTPRRIHLLDPLPGWTWAVRSPLRRHS